MSITKSLVFCSALALLAAPSFAVESKVIDKRIENQDQRIEAGVKSGQLNEKEATRLEKQETKIEANVAAAKADGQVTPREAIKINRQERLLNRHIAVQKHDRQRAK